MQISAAPREPCCGCGVAVPQGEAFCLACWDALYDLADAEGEADYLAHWRCAMGEVPWPA